MNVEEGVLPPAPEVTEGARFIFMIVVYITIVISIAIAALSFRAYLDYSPPAAQECTVSPTHECTVIVQGSTGKYSAYWIEWQHAAGLASPTPEPTAKGKNP